MASEIPQLKAAVSKSFSVTNNNVTSYQIRLLQVPKSCCRKQRVVLLGAQFQNRGKLILTGFLNFSASTNTLPFTVIGLGANYSIHLFFKRPPVERKLNIWLSKLSSFHKHLHLNISGAKEFKDNNFTRFVNDKVDSIANTFRESGLQPSPERLHVNQVL